MALFGKDQPPLVGIDISSTSIKLLELSRSGKNYKVESYAVEPLPANAIQERSIADIEAVGQAIGRAVKKSGTKTREAVCAVSGSAVITKVITIDGGLSDEEVEAQVLNDAENYIPYPLDEIRLDFEVLKVSEQDNKKVDVLLAASRKENVEDRVSALEVGGLSVKVVDVEAFAMENAVKLMAEQIIGSVDGTTIAVADVGATMTVFSVLQEGKIIYSREQPFGGKQLTEEIQRRYSLSYEEAGLAKRQGGLPANYELEVLDPFKASMAMEISRALQFFYSASQISAVDHILVAGGCAAIPGIKEIIEEKTGTNVSIANPFGNMQAGGRVKLEALRSDAPALMVACGLALRSFD